MLENVQLTLNTATENSFPGPSSQMGPAGVETLLADPGVRGHPLTSPHSPRPCPKLPAKVMTEQLQTLGQEQMGLSADAPLPP